MPLTTYTAGEVLTAASLNNNFTVAAANGYVLVKSQVIGTTVASVNVTSAFSTTYDSYKIVINGGAGSTNQDMQMKLGSTATGYYNSATFGSWVGASATGSGSNAAYFSVATYNTNTLFLNLEIFNPFNASPTIITGTSVDPTTTGRFYSVGGYLANTTSYTDFTLTPGGGTISGGTIYVYGLAKA